MTTPRKPLPPLVETASRRTRGERQRDADNDGRPIRLVDLGRHVVRALDRAQDARWQLSVADAIRMSQAIAPVEMSGDHRPTIGKLVG